MKNFKFIISYDGSRYFGWERQPGRDTIQGKLEAVLTRMCGTDVQVIGAGRTDAGVHARAMAANAYMNTEKTPEEIRDYMNRYLPDDICVQEAKLAADRFHARYRRRRQALHLHLLRRRYEAGLLTANTSPCSITSRILPPCSARRNISHRRAWLPESFCSNPQMKKSTVRIVDSIEIVRRKEYIYFNYHGTGFLQNMVRILTGTLLEVGQGKRAPESVRQTLEAKDRTQAGYAAAPAGAVPDAGGLLKEPAARLKVFYEFATAVQLFLFRFSERKPTRFFFDLSLRNQDQFKNSDTVLEGVVGADAYIGPAECAVFMEIFSEFCNFPTGRCGHRPRQGSGESALPCKF